MILNLSIHTERYREQEYNFAGDLKADYEKSRIDASLHYQQEDADEGYEKAAEEVKS